MSKLLQIAAIGAVSLTLSVTAAVADEVTVKLSKISVDGVGAAIGTITMKDWARGMMIFPDLSNLPEGNHGFHIHENPNCGPGVKDGKKVAGLMAGGHYGSGDATNGDAVKLRGDLPQLAAAANGIATKPVVTNRLKVSDVRGRAIMVHRYGENDPGKPKGGGARFACGVIPK